MILGDPRRKKYIHLIANTDGYRSAKVIKDEPWPTPFESLDDTGDYKNYFIELENAISIEKHRLLDILNDTRNYQKRTSAIFSGDSICIFTEPLDALYAKPIAIILAIQFPCAQFFKRFVGTITPSTPYAGDSSGRSSVHLSHVIAHTFQLHSSSKEV